MSIEQIEKGKARTDLFIFVMFIIWIATRILCNFEVVGFEIVTYFTSLVVILSVVFLGMRYLYLSAKFKDELDEENKHKAHKFSWVVMMMSAVLLYVLCHKTKLSAQFSLELILWIGYFSYFISFKFFDAGLDAKFSEKSRKVLGAISLFIVSLVIGINFGFNMPDPDSKIISENQLLFYGISIVIFIVAVVYLTKFYLLLKQENEIRKIGDR